MSRDRTSPWGEDAGPLPKHPPTAPRHAGTDALTALRDRVAELEAIVAVLEPTLGTCECGARLIGQHYSYELCDCGARVAMQRWEPRR